MAPDQDDPHGSAPDAPHDPAGILPDLDQKALPPPAAKAPSPREAIVDALMELAGERVWEDISITDVATRANLSLADFRDAYPSKGAVLAAFSRRIDRVVLEGTTGDLAGEPAKERLFDVLMRRLDALAPYRLGVECVAEWLNRAPLAAATINRLVQGLVLVWGRVLRAWFRDDDPGYAATMAVLDRELTRGGRFVERADDINRLVSPLISLARAMFERRPDYPRETADSFKADEPAAGA